MRNFLYTLRWYVSVFVVLFLGIALVKYSKWMDYKLFGPFKRPQTTTKQPARNDLSLPNPITSQPKPLAPQDARVQISQANSLLSEASIYAAEALKEILTWQHEVEPLRNRQLGETAVERDELFEKLAYVFREERMSAEQLRTASLRIDSWRLKLEGLSKQADPKPLTVVEMAEISELHRKCKTANESWELALERAFAITRIIVPSSSTSSEPETPPTLEAKIAEANAKVTIADLEDEIEHERVRKAEQRELDAEIERQQTLKAEQAAEQLEKATSPEIQAMLAPFLTARSVQPSMSGAAIQLKSTMESRPMSLAALRAINALTPTDEGYKRLAGIGGHRELSAPKWSIHSQPHNWSESDREMLMNAQQMLRDYGPTLVEAKRLTP